jgi:hypothetical protein
MAVHPGGGPAAGCQEYDYVELCEHEQTVARVHVG